MPEYTVLTALAVLAVVAAELTYFKSGIFSTAQYWWTMLIIFAFQIPVDGWLTKLSAPIVRYDPDQKTPWRFPWDIPVEDFPFGIAMLTMVLLLWVRQDGRDPDEDDYRRGLPWRRRP